MPLRRVQQHAIYMFDVASGASELVRDAAHLTALAPGEFDGTLVAAPGETWWQLVLDGLHNPSPWHIVAVIAVWLVCLAYIAWRWLTGQGV